MNIGSFYFYLLCKKQQISTYFGGAKGGANQEIFHLHLLSLFDAVCQYVT